MSPYMCSEIGPISHVPVLGDGIDARNVTRGFCPAAVRGGLR
jgi:hypothetical protein